MVVGIIGTGVIGGSIGLRARACGFHVLGYDAGEAALDAALQTKAIDERSTRAALLERADTIVIAAPIDATVAEIGILRESSNLRATLAIDVASVKAPIVAAARGLANFVATHPMAGSERSGAVAARADLFDGKNWLYVVPADDGLESRARAFIQSMGATPITVDAVQHDRIAALTSHVPQLIAFAFAKRVRALGPAAEALCGPVARELLRLGNSNPLVWDPIFEANEANVSAELRLLLAELSG